MEINEQNTTDGHAPGEQDLGNEAGIPLGIGEEGGDELSTFSATPSSGKKLNSGAMLLIVVIVVAAAGLFSMRTLTRASAANSGPNDIEKLIDEFLPTVDNGAAGGSGGVLGVLNESYAERQVPLESVQRNPFVLFEPTISLETPATSGQDPTAARRAQRTLEFEQAADGLHLRMILMGSQPLASINDTVVRVGESIQVDESISFVVTAIAPNRVDLIAEDDEIGVQYEKQLYLR